MVFDANARQINGYLHAHHIVLAISVLQRGLATRTNNHATKRNLRAYNGVTIAHSYPFLLLVTTFYFLGPSYPGRYGF
jgi:hypothetical protein